MTGNHDNLVLCERQSGVAVVRMNHGKVNAMNLEFCLALEQTFQELERDDSVTAVILAGNSRVFSAGVDLKRLVAERVEYVDEFLPAIRRMFLQVFSFRKPLVAAVSGAALAGGCVVASAADYRVLARDARIGMPELRVGLALPSEGIECFRFAVAAHYFQRVVTSGASFQNEAALQAGLADMLVEPERISETSRRFAQEYQQIPSEVFAVTKQQIRRPILNRMRETEAAFGHQVRQLWKDPAVRAKVAAYVQERL